MYFIARNFPYFTRARQFCWCDYHKKSADFMTEHYNAVKLGLWSCCSPLQWWVSSLQRWGMIAFIDYMIYGYCTRISRMLMKGTPTAYCRYLALWYSTEPSALLKLLRLGIQQVPVSITLLSLVYVSETTASFYYCSLICSDLFLSLKLSKLQNTVLFW